MNFAKKVFRAALFVALAVGICGCSGNAKKVTTALSGTEWYFNGGSDFKLNHISFTDSEAKIETVHFSGNGIGRDEEINYKYSVKDSEIRLSRDDGDKLEIPYVLSESEIVLGNGDFYDINQIENELQGYWTMRYSDRVLGVSTEGEENVYIGNGSFEYEHAAKSLLVDGYAYFPPKQFRYKLGVGSISNPDKHTLLEWGFNIIDGKPVLMHFDQVFSRNRTNSFPGRYGYSF